MPGSTLSQVLAEERTWPAPANRRPSRRRGKSHPAPVEIGGWRGQPVRVLSTDRSFALELIS